MQTRLAQFGFGRMLLHTVCACQDHHYAWHWRGVIREFGRSKDRFTLRPNRVSPAWTNRSRRSGAHRLAGKIFIFSVILFAGAFRMAE
jgi:hypothetical protein